MSEGTTLLVTVRGAARLRQLLSDTPYRACTVAHSSAEARRVAAQDLLPLILINAPLPDESGVNLAAELAASTSAAVMLLVKTELMPLVSDAAGEAGVLLAQKPIVPPLFEQALRLAISCSNRLQLLKNENARLQKRLEELRVIDRAKCLLIEHMRCTEEEAHRMLEKQAMDARVPRVRVARQILERFEL